MNFTPFHCYMMFKPSENRGKDKMRACDPRLVESANKAYHRAEAELYDEAHPEILWCERANLQSFANRYIRGMNHPITVLDIGAGTGFVGSVLQNALESGDRYIASDISPEMLGVLQVKMRDSHIIVETVVCSANDLRVFDESVDVVIISSAVHHLPDIEGMKIEVARVLKPGGLFAVMHEPNIAFSSSGLFRQVARFASIVASRVDPPVKKGGVSDYTPVYEAVNEALLRDGLIDRPLEKADIQRLVDVHSPTAGGYYEPIGFAPLQWRERGVLEGWDILAFETYNFLGNLDPSARLWRRCIERTCKWFVPNCGSLFTIVYRKTPHV